jgi:ComF family protein
MDAGIGLCGNCLQNPVPWNKFYFYGVYAGYLRELLHRIKFCQGLPQAEALGRLLAGKFPSAQSGATPEYHCVLPMPLHKNSLRERGFNQSVFLAGPLAKKLKIPLFRELLVKSVATLPQHGLSRELRLRNVRGVFSVTKAPPPRVLLLDDVLTTGATMRAAALCLLRAGAERVDAVVLARTPVRQA